MAAALEGLRVLDLSHLIAGPFATKWLADYGADVIKVEPPWGEAGRRLGPFPDDQPHPERSGMFLYLNTNKRGITLNLKTATGKHIFRELVRWADVLVENFAPRVMPSLGLSYEELARINRRLVMVSISNFGQTGPYRDRPATDLVLYGMSGLLYGNGDLGRPPVRHGLTQAQIWGGISAVSATMAAVTVQELLGIGQHVDVSILESMTAGLMGHISTYSYTGTVRGRSEIEGVFNRGLVPVKDGEIAPIILGGMTWEDFAAFLEMPELNDPRFATAAARLENAAALDELILPKFAQREKRELFHAAQAWRFPFGIAQTAKDLAECPQLEARSFWTSVDVPGYGTLRMPGPLVEMSATPWRLHRPAPQLGQHNVEVYGELLGYTSEDLVRLRELGVI